MKRNRDVGAVLVAGTLLLLCVSYLTQCRSGPQSQKTVPATPLANPAAESRQEGFAHKREAERKPKSVREFAAEEEKEERAKIRGISRALRTAAADPEFRRTYGFPK
jgi:hypothetical protein